MNKYRWNIKDIRNQMNMDLKNPNILNNQDLLSSTKAFYETLFSAYDINRTVSCYTDYDDESYEYKFPNLNSDALVLLKNKLGKINNIDVIDTNYYKLAIKLSNDDIISIAEEIIAQIPSKEILNEFKKLFYSSNQTNIVFNKYNINPIHGICTVDFNNNIPYIAIFRNNSVIDILCIIHEFFHSYIRKYENSNFNKSPSNIYCESEGYFANFITDYLSKKIFKEDLFSQTIYCDFNNFVVTAKTIMSNYIDDNEKGELVSDAFSYLVGLDLFSIYEKDPEKALFYLKKISSLTGNNIEKELLNNEMTFINDEFKNIKRIMKKLKWQKI